MYAHIFTSACFKFLQMEVLLGLMSMAIERAIGLLFAPSPVSRRRACLLIAGFWLVSFCFSAPILTGVIPSKPYRFRYLCAVGRSVTCLQAGHGLSVGVRSRTRWSPWSSTAAVCSSCCYASAPSYAANRSGNCHRRRTITRNLFAKRVPSKIILASGVSCSLCSFASSSFRVPTSCSTSLSR